METFEKQPRGPVVETPASQQQKNLITNENKATRFYKYETPAELEKARKNLEELITSEAIRFYQYEQKILLHGDKYRDGLGATPQQLQQLQEDFKWMNYQRGDWKAALLTAGVPEINEVRERLARVNIAVQLMGAIDDALGEQEEKLRRIRGEFRKTVAPNN